MPTPRHHPSEIRQVAYEIWALRAARSPQRTAELLAEEHDYSIGRSMVDYWSKSEAWADRFTDDMERAFPVHRKETASNLVVAGVIASRKLLAHLNGEKLERGEDTIIFGALDRAGFSPVGSRDPLGSSVPQLTQQSSLLDKLLSAEERAAIAAEALPEAERFAYNTPEREDARAS